MPRLTPKTEETKNQAATEQILAFLSVKPVRLDGTEAEINEILREAEEPDEYFRELGRLGYFDDELESLQETQYKRHKLRSERAFKLQLEVYRHYNQGKGIREIASIMDRPVSTIQRALGLAKTLAGDRYQLTPASKSVVFAEIEKCPKCRKNLAAGGNWCNEHDDKLARVTETNTYQREKTVDSLDLVSDPLATASSLDMEFE